jgi:chromosome segregation ATPase
LYHFIRKYSSSKQDDYEPAAQGAQEELQRVCRESAIQLEEAKMKAETLTHSVGDAFEQLQTTMSQVESIKEEHKMSLEALRTELDSKAAAREEEIKQEIPQQAEEKALAQVQGQSKQNEEEMAKVRADITAQFEAKLSDTKEAHAVDYLRSSARLPRKA